MNLRALFRPKPTISDEDLASGLRWFTLEGAASLGFFSITTSGFLAAYALALGASNFQIGILAAIPFIMQTLQLPAIWLVEKYRRRKVISLLTWLPAQLLWLPMAFIPFLIETPSPAAISLLLILMTARGFLAGICNCSWNGWIRDLIPQKVLGRLFSRRLAYATAAGVMFSLGAAFFTDYWRAHSASQAAIFGYSYVLIFGALFIGLASPVFMAMMPEPLMQNIPGVQPSLRQRMLAPVRDRNFRQLLQFLLFWGIASNLAIPFFAVYMLIRLGLPLSWVIALSVLSQFFNILFLRIWGRFLDRFGNKSVLSLCASLYLLVIGGWIFTTMPERYFLTMPLLVMLHVFAGIANAGVTLGVGTIGLKLAPQGEATSYLASASLATNVGGGLGPILGGLLADFFSTRQLDLTFTWSSPFSHLELSALSITGFDFLFGIAFIFGVMTLGTLATIREAGEVSREVVLESLFFPTRELSRPLSSVPAYNLLSNFPFGYLKRVPIPGLDAALGVTAYQIAEMARAASLAAVRGHRLTRKFARALGEKMAVIWKPGEEVKELGAEITRQAARGAIQVLEDKTLDIGKIVDSVTAGVVKVITDAGLSPLNGIAGASQGVIQGAAETKTDLGVVALHTIEAAKGIAKKVGLSEEMAVAAATESILQTADAISPQAGAHVREAILQERKEPEPR